MLGQRTGREREKQKRQGNLSGEPGSRRRPGVQRGQQFRPVQFSHSVMSDSATPWTAAHQASLSITNSQSLLKLMPIESVMPSNHLILCCPLLLPPSLFPSIRVSSSESVLCIRWPWAVLNAAKWSKMPAGTDPKGGACWVQAGEAGREPESDALWNRLGVKGAEERSGVSRARGLDSVCFGLSPLERVRVAETQASPCVAGSRWHQG